MQQKKIPMRQCVGCRAMFPKKELLRVVRSPEGEVSLDFKGKKSGRGAYICHSQVCLEKARKAGALQRTLQCEIPAAVFDQMNAEMEDAEADE